MAVDEESSVKAMQAVIVLIADNGLILHLHGKPGLIGIVGNAPFRRRRGGSPGH